MKQKLMMMTFGGALCCITPAASVSAQSCTLTATITNPVPAISDHFGLSVAGVGDTLLFVGAPRANVGATDAGAAYLFDLAGDLIATYTNPAPATAEYFGWAVAGVGTDRVLVGAYMDDSGGVDAGAAYLFDVAANLITTYTNPTPAAGDQFGCAVAPVGTNHVLIGALGESAAAEWAGAAYLFDLTDHLLTTYSNPTPDFEDEFGGAVTAVGDDRVLIGACGESAAAVWAGAAYLFDLTGHLLTTYTNPAPADGDDFGRAVAAVGGNYVLIGAEGDDTGATDAGAAYLYDLAGNLVTTYTNPAPAILEYFGWSVAGVGSNHVLIGAYGAGASNPAAGSAYLFDLAGQLLVTITNPTPASNDFFGYAVNGVGGNRVLIGAWSDDTGTNNAGAAYLFTLGDVAPAAPRLAISFTPQLSTAQLSWMPATGTNWVLQENLNLAATNWVNSPSGATNPIVVPATLPAKFYRLHKP